MRRVVVLSAILSSMYANMQPNLVHYNLNQSDRSIGRYFIKFAACRYLDNAKKIQSLIDYPTRIIFLRDYYSVVSSEFKDKNIALRELKKAKKIKDDAYLITLYKQDIQTPKIQQKDDDNKRYANSLFKNKSYEEALMEYDLLLIDNPDDVVARLYYAKSLYHLALYKEAKAEFEKVLTYPLSSRQKAEVKYYLKEIEKERKNSFFGATVGLGVGYDDNINQNSYLKTTQYGQYTLINDTSKTTSTYGIATLNLNHRYNADSFDIYSSFYSYNEFAHTTKGNDLNFLDLSLAMAKSFDSFRFYLPFGYNISFLDGENIGYNLYTKPTISHSFTPMINGYIESRFIDNTTKYAKHRDYRDYGATIGSRYKNESFIVGGGINRDSFRAKKDVRYDISKDEIGAFIYSRYYTMLGVFFGVNSSYTKDNFTNLDPQMGYKREDKISSYGAEIGKNIGKNITINTTYQYKKVRSNINAYTYDKNRYLFDVKYRF